MLRLCPLLAAVALASPAFADTKADLKQLGLKYDEKLLTSCLKGKSGDARQGCIGKASSACVTGNDSTAGTVACTSAEIASWEKILTANYAKAMKTQKADDANPDLNSPSSPPQREKLLREMERSWITYRRAQCDLVTAQYGGGSGSGPAANTCWMNATAREALLLQDFLDQYEAQ